jgi:hypothetical protein
MHLKSIHFKLNFACILGRFLVYIELNLNTKYTASSINFNNFILSINFIVAIILNLIDTVRYIKYLYSFSKAFRNRKKD